MQPALLDRARTVSQRHADLLRGARHAGPRVRGGTLGAPRLAMLVTRAPCGGPIPSKTEAGRWVIDNLPDHADLARRALAARSGEPVTFTVADGRQSADLVILLVQGHD